MRRGRGTLLAAAALGALWIPQRAMAQAALVQGPTTAPTDEIIVTGTRVSGTKASDSLSPINILPSSQLEETGQASLRDALMQILPTVNHQTQGTTVGALTDSLNLLGVSPNDTLVLVDGIRRHPTASTQTDAGPFRGATPVDLDLIPISLIDHVEVLRDGASAQYGSDAVAGVINIILKTADHGGDISSQTGAYYARDGLTENLNLDAGLPIGTSGFLDLAANYLHHDRTDRTGINGLDGLHDSHWVGDPLSDRESVGLNAGYTLGSGAELYGFSTLAHRTAQTFQIYRLPTVLPAIYPDGFSPRLTSDEYDYAATIGLRGEDLWGWSWDVSSTYGGDQVNVNLYDSANTTLYAETGSTPTSFHLSQNNDTQWTNDAEIKRALAPNIFASPINVAFGAEQRRETYLLGAGSYGSYAVGGSQSVPGVLPTSAVNVGRDVYAVYTDLSTAITPQWKLDAAGRFEHYTDFGDTEAGKVSTRYDITPQLGVRATFNNSIRAPTLAEEYHTSMTVTTSGATGELAPNSPGAKVLGAPPLKPEESSNVTAGVVVHPVTNLEATLDGYRLDIRDRILDGGSYSGALALAAFDAQGRTLPAGTALSAVSASYLTNGADTHTEGLDLTAHYRISLTGGDRLTLEGALNLNDTNITHIGVNRYGQSLLNLQQIGYLTTDAPHNVEELGATWDVKKFTVVLREQRYGHIFDQMTYQQGPNAFSTRLFQPYTLRPRYLTDLSVGYHVTDTVSVTIGANNLFDTYPNKVPVLASYYGQVPYDRYAQQIAFNGGYYYASVGYHF